REFLEYNKDPDLLGREIENLYKKPDKRKSLTVWIDEIQKIPQLLDVVHHCIEKYKSCRFILTGSSARKLRRDSANLLGGRALDLRLHSLAYEELAEAFDLDLALYYGTLPHIYELLENNDVDLAKDLLSSYVTTYLNDEIRQEGLVRSLDSFQRFVEVAAAQFAELVNFSKIADDCLTSSPTVQNYYSILEDTLIGSFLSPYASSVRKQLSKQSKFYFFDNGVTRAITGDLASRSHRMDKGHLFEQLVFNELRKVNDYHKKSLKFNLWRTYDGLEVDFLISRGRNLLLAVECKSASQVQPRDFVGLKSFSVDFPKVRKVLCCTTKNSLIHDDIEVIDLPTLLGIVQAL
ncbi:MAG: ATP-binding protein, partial [Bdellovibrionales bacterium]|nr:ATP-binding protein [Bdellovibrionales bacterium]